MAYDPLSAATARNSRARLGRFLAAVRSSFVAYARWLDSISWKRFFLLSLLAMVVAGILSNLPPFNLKWGEDRTVAAPPTSAKKKSDAPNVFEGKGHRGRSYEIGIDETGVHVRPSRTAASAPEPTGPGVSVTPDSGVTIRLPKNADTEEIKEAIEEARMAAMQAQVEPHFLFNTLASIDHLIETDPPRASKMQKNLIALLRAAMPTMREANAQGTRRDLGRERSRQARGDGGRLGPGLRPRRDRGHRHRPEQHPRTPATAVRLAGEPHGGREPRRRHRSDNHRAVHDGEAGRTRYDGLMSTRALIADDERLMREQLSARLREVWPRGESQLFRAFQRYVVGSSPCR